MIVSEKLCFNCRYGEYAKELCGFYPDRDMVNGCKHFKPKRTEEDDKSSNQVNNEK